MNKEIFKITYKINNIFIDKNKKCYKCKSNEYNEYYECIITNKIYCGDCCKRCEICYNYYSNEIFQKCIICERKLYICILESIDKEKCKKTDFEGYLIDGNICKFCYKMNEVISLYCHRESCATRENAKKYYNKD